MPETMALGRELQPWRLQDGTPGQCLEWPGSVDPARTLGDKGEWQLQPRGRGPA